jgi:hypothetical protein
MVRLHHLNNAKGGRAQEGMGEAWETVRSHCSDDAKEGTVTWGTRHMQKDFGKSHRREGNMCQGLFLNLMPETPGNGWVHKKSETLAKPKGNLAGSDPVT